MERFPTPGIKKVIAGNSSPSGVILVILSPAAICCNLVSISELIIPVKL